MPFITIEVNEQKPAELVKSVRSALLFDDRPRLYSYLYAFMQNWKNRPENVRNSPESILLDRLLREGAERLRDSRIDSARARCKAVRQRLLEYSPVYRNEAQELARRRASGAYDM
jgi:hypothetical protein